MERKPVAVFISNLRTLRDMTDLFPPEWHAKVAAARVSPGYVASPPFDVLGRATGYLVLMLRSGAEVMKSPVDAAHLVLEMTRYAAQDLDGDVIGLGSLTTSITKSGNLVQEHIDLNGWKIRATHGDAGSTAAILACIEGRQLPHEARIAVVGAYGVIGGALSRALAEQGRTLTLMGRQKEKLDRLVATLPMSPGLRAVNDLSGIADADCIVTVTSHVSTLLTPDIIRPGAVIIDPSVPANVANDARWIERGNVIISNASQVRVPGVAVRSAMFGTFDEPDGCPTTYACLAETLVNAVCGDKRHHVGEIRTDFIAEMWDRFRQVSFAHAVPRSFGVEIP